MQKVKQVFSNSSDKSTDSAHSPTQATSTTGAAGNTYTNRSSVGDSPAGTRTSTGSVSGARGLDNQAGAASSHTSPTIGGGRGAATGERTTEAGTTSGQGVASKVFGNHTHGHGVAHANDIDANNASHEHQHLKHVTHNDVRHIETEEVLRQREVDRHIHHVQHHVQPVKDQEIRDEVHHEKIQPVTNVYEKHSSTEHDQAKYAQLGAGFKNEEVHHSKERTIVDLGEKVNENVHHHVHHVIQPVIEREVQDRHRIHTVIPVKHETHEAPIVHQSTTHEPLAIKDFLSKGGKLDSATTHGDAGVLHAGDCERKVDGMGEDLARSLHLGGTETSTTRI